jgi:hypothetical protein
MTRFDSELPGKRALSQAQSFPASFQEFPKLRRHACHVLFIGSVAARIVWRTQAAQRWLLLHGNVDAAVHLSFEPNHDTDGRASSDHATGFHGRRRRPAPRRALWNRGECSVARGSAPQECSSGLRKLECRASADARKPCGPTGHRDRPKHAYAETCLSGRLHGLPRSLWCKALSQGSRVLSSRVNITPTPLASARMRRR